MFWEYKEIIQPTVNNLFVILIRYLWTYLILSNEENIDVFINYNAIFEDTSESITINTNNLTNLKLAKAWYLSIGKDLIMETKR